MTSGTPHPKAREADIALLLEGTFPYVSGGVSSWINQMKVKKASIVGFLLALLLMAGNSCSDDNPYLSNENGSVLETTKDFKLSSFPL